MKKFLLYFIAIFSGSVSANMPMQYYRSTSLESIENLQEMFNSLNKSSKPRSQCYDRAHFWSYQMYRDYGVNSTKYFVFFTQKYKREIYGQWWFHVAPGVEVLGDEYVLDPEFVSKAIPLKTWMNGVLDHAIWKLTPLKINYENEINKLVKELAELEGQNSRRAQKRRQYINNRVSWLKAELKRMLISESALIDVTEENWAFPNPPKEKMIDINCIETQFYSEYVNNQEDTYCYLIKTPMYYWAPKNVQLLELEGEPLQFFSNSEVYTAFKRGFKGRFPYRFED